MYIFGESKDIVMYAKSICPAYYKPYYDTYYVDLYPNSIFADKYIQEIKITNHIDGDIGDKVKINAKAYKLGNKFTLKYIDCEYVKNGNK